MSDEEEKLDADGNPIEPKPLPAAGMRPDGTMEETPAREVDDATATGVFVPPVVALTGFGTPVVKIAIPTGGVGFVDQGPSVVIAPVPSRSPVVKDPATQTMRPGFEHKAPSSPWAQGGNERTLEPAEHAKAEFLEKIIVDQDVRAILALERALKREEELKEAELRVEIKPDLIAYKFLEDPANLFLWNAQKGRSEPVDIPIDILLKDKKTLDKARLGWFSPMTVAAAMDAHENGLDSKQALMEAIKAEHLKRIADRDLTQTATFTPPQLLGAPVVPNPRGGGRGGREG